jgi:hypothetical protein
MIVIIFLSYLNKIIDLIYPNILKMLFKNQINKLAFTLKTLTFTPFNQTNN